MLYNTVQADSQPKSSSLVWGRWPLGAILHSSNELGELSQWLCHDDSTINIVVIIIITIIIIIIIVGCVNVWVYIKRKEEQHRIERTVGTGTSQLCD